MAKESNTNKKVPGNLQQMQVHYLKTPGYKTFHVDGVFGGVTPRGNIYMELFVERAPTPQKITHQITADGGLGEEVTREGKTGLIREIEAGIIVDLSTARLIKEWLAQKIAALETALKNTREK